MAARRGQCPSLRVQVGSTPSSPAAIPVRGPTTPRSRRDALETPATRSELLLPAETERSSGLAEATTKTCSRVATGNRLRRHSPGGVGGAQYGALATEATVDARSAQRLTQIMAARTIERHYHRHANASPSQIYADVEQSMQVEWGTVRFVGVRRPQAVSALSGAHETKYMRVAADVSAHRVVRLVHKFWKVPRPSAVIELTGGAASLQLLPSVDAALCRGLAAAAACSNAMLVTGGTNSGVMGLAGRAVARSSLPLTLLGFTSWRNICDRDLLEHNAGAAAPRSYPVNRGAVANGTAELEPHHTHFVLVDGGEGGGWGCEAALRRRVLETYRALYKVPVVLVVAGGGLGTLREVEQAVHASRTRVVLVRSTGGAADALARFIDGMIAFAFYNPVVFSGFAGNSASLSLESSSLSLVSHRAGCKAYHQLEAAAKRDGSESSGSSSADAAAFDESLRSIEALQLMASARAHAQRGGLIVSFKMDEHDGGTLDTMILRSILESIEEMDSARLQREPCFCAGASSSRGAHSSAGGAHVSAGRAHLSAGAPRLDSAVRTAVLWNSSDMLHELLRKRQQQAHAVAARSTPQVRDVPPHDPFLASVQQAVMVALENGRSQALEPLLGTFSALRGVHLPVLWASQADALGLGRAFPSLQQLAKLPINLRALDASESAAIYERHVLQGVLKPLLPPLALAFGARLRRRSAKTDASDVFVWALCFGQWAMARVLWRHVGLPLHYALIAAVLCRGVAARLPLKAETLREQADEFETHAVALLDELPSQLMRGGQAERNLLLDHYHELGGCMLEFARDGALRRFLSHRLCRHVVSSLTYQSRGLALPRDESSAAVLARAIGLRSLDDCEDVRHKELRERSRKLPQAIKRQLQKDLQPLGGFQRWMEYFRIPIVKLVLRNVLYILYLVLFSFIVLLRAARPPPSKTGTILDLVFTVWTVSLAVDEFHQARSSPFIAHAYWHGFWNWLDWLTLLMLALAVTLDWTSFCLSRGLSLSVVDTSDTAALSESLEHASLLLLGLSGVPLYLRVLKSVEQQQDLGVLIITLGQILSSDMRLFAQLFLLLLGGFGVALVAVVSFEAGLAPLADVHSTADLFVPPDEKEAWTVTSVLAVPFWALVGESWINQVQAASPLIGAVLLWTYIVAAQVLLLNLLIAMMTNTYSQYMENAREGYMSSTVHRLFHTRLLYAVPPPFNLPFLLGADPHAWRLDATSPEEAKSEGGRSSDALSTREDTGSCSARGGDGGGGGGGHGVGGAGNSARSKKQLAAAVALGSSAKDLKLERFERERLVRASLESYLKRSLEQDRSVSAQLGTISATLESLAQRQSEDRERLSTLMKSIEAVGAALRGGRTERAAVGTGGAAALARARAVSAQTSMQLATARPPLSRCEGTPAESEGLSTRPCSTRGQPNEPPAAVDPMYDEPLATQTDTTALIQAPAVSHAQPQPFSLLSARKPRSVDANTEQMHARRPAPDAPKDAGLATTHAQASVARPSETHHLKRYASPVGRVAAGRHGSARTPLQSSLQTPISHGAYTASAQDGRTDLER